MCPCDSGKLTLSILLRHLNLTTELPQNHLNSRVQRNTVKQSGKNEKTDTTHYDEMDPVVSPAFSVYSETVVSFQFPEHRC